MYIYIYIYIYIYAYTHTQYHTPDYISVLQIMLCLLHSMIFISNSKAFVQ